MKDEFYMQLALDKAWEYQGLTYPNPAVGAVVTLGGNILAIEAHQQAGTSHAEVHALLTAYEILSKTQIDFDPKDAKQAHDFLLNLPKDFFSECTIYVTLEPCLMCVGAIVHARVARLVYGAGDPKIGAVASQCKILELPGLNHRVEVTGGVMAAECSKVLKQFFRARRR